MHINARRQTNVIEEISCETGMTFNLNHKVLNLSKSLYALSVRYHNLG